MAKKIDPATQSKSYLSNLLGDTSMKPLPQSAVNPLPAGSIPYNPRSEADAEGNMNEKPHAGRKKKNRETKIRTSFTVLPSAFDNLRRIAYIERKSVSSILGDFIARYVESHQSALSEYSKLSAEEREELEASWR